MGGLALLSPEQLEVDGGSEFGLAAMILSRFITPPIAVLIIAYLAHRDGMLEPQRSLGQIFRTTALPSIGAVLGVVVFGTMASVLVVPGVAFFLATSVIVPVLVIEAVSPPAAIKRSWELTRNVRWPLLLFWSGYFLMSAIVLFGVVTLTSSVMVPGEAALPLVQNDAFLPGVFTSAVLYAGLVIASYELYCQLVEKTGGSDR